MRVITACDAYRITYYYERTTGLTAPRLWRCKRTLCAASRKQWTFKIKDEREMPRRRKNPSWPGLYQIVEREDSFTLTIGVPADEPVSPDWIWELTKDFHGLQRYPVTVTQRPYSWQVDVEGDLPAYMKHTDVDLMYWLSLFRTITESFIYPYKGVDPALYADERSEHDPNRRDPARPYDWKKYLLEKCRRVLYKRLLCQYQRLLGRINEDVRSVHKSLFVNCFGYPAPQIVKSPDFYDRRYIVHDVLTYRAAAIACYLADSIDHLESWQGLFSPTGQPYRSLNRTLTALPAGMSPELVSRLREVELERPIYDRVELIVAIAGRDSHNRRVFMHAQRGDIEDAFRRVSEKIGGNLRGTNSICRFINYLMDYPELHHGKILGLAKKAIHWHRQDSQEQERQRALSRFGPEKPTAPPPIPLPTDPHVRFLSRVNEISDEGRVMKHCVGSRSYVEKAVNGACYIFHTDYQDQAATVEVDRWGNVVQAHGPLNQDNAATSYGSKALNNWGHQLKNFLESSATEMAPVEAGV
jgi:PcfJ-like protein